MAVNESRAHLAGEILALDPKDTESEWAVAIHELMQNPEKSLELGETRPRINAEGIYG